MIRITIAAPVLAALLFAAPACSKKDDSASAPSPQALAKAQEANKAAEASKAAEADKVEAPPTRLMIIAETPRKAAKAAAKGGADSSGESKETPYRRVVREPVFEKGERVAGDTDDIKLPYETARKMDIEGEDEIAILARLCLDAAGTPTSATIVEGSGYEQADQSVRDEIMTWAYEPYSVDGKPVPFCELLTFRISLKDGLG